MVIRLKWIYIILFLVVLFCALIKKKNLSFVLVYFLSSVLFYYNAFVGDVFVGKLNQIGVDSYPINYGTYIILIVNLVIIFLFIIIDSEKNDYRFKTTQSSEITVMNVFLVAVFALSLYMCIHYGVFFRASYNKSQLAEDTGSIGTYYKYLASFAFVYVFTKDGTKLSIPWRIIGSIPIFTTFLFGNRSFLVISLVAVLFDKVYLECNKFKYGLVRFLSKHKKIVIAAGILLFATLVVKGVTSALFTGNFDLVKQRLSNVDYYKQVFYVSEPNTIMTNLNTIVSNNYQVEKSTYAALWAYLFPLITGQIEKMMGVESFTKVYQRVLYVTNTNRASTHLGEAYANGGYIIVPLVIILYLILILVISKGYRRCTSDIGKTTFLLMGIDAAFYIQRNSMAYEFSRLRDYIYIAVILIIAIGLLNREHKIRI